MKALNLCRKGSLDYDSSDDDDSPAKKCQVITVLLKRTLAKMKLIDSQYDVPLLSHSRIFCDSEFSSNLFMDWGIVSLHSDCDVGLNYNFNTRSLFDFSVVSVYFSEKYIITTH